MKPTKVRVLFFGTTTKQAHANVSLTLSEPLEKLLKLPDVDGTKRTQEKRDKILAILEKKLEDMLSQIEIE